MHFMFLFLHNYQLFLIKERKSAFYFFQRSFKNIQIQMFIYKLIRNMRSFAVLISHIHNITITLKRGNTNPSISANKSISIFQLKFVYKFYIFINLTYLPSPLPAFLLMGRRNQGTLRRVHVLTVRLPPTA